jgi:hypothetical protein
MSTDQALGRTAHDVESPAGLDVVCRCEGFSVDSPEGRLGILRGLRYAPSTHWDRPNALAVRAGRSSDILLIVPVQEIERVIVGQRRITLRSSPTIAATERVAARPEGAEAEGGNGAAAAGRSEHPSVRIVAGARRRVLAGWCQGRMAEDKDGHARDALSSEARRWSILGALIASWGGGPVHDLGHAVAALHTSTEKAPLEVWNDRPGRTQEEVVAALAQAIDSLAGSAIEATPSGGTHGANGGGRAPSPQQDPSIYWLSTCKGFQVDSERGRIGIVEEVRFSPRNAPEALAVRVGLFRTRLVIVPVSDVEYVLPRRKRVVVRTGEELSGAA